METKVVSLDVDVKDTRLLSASIENGKIKQIYELTIVPRGKEHFHPSMRDASVVLVSKTCQRTKKRQETGKVIGNIKFSRELPVVSIPLIDVCKFYRLYSELGFEDILKQKYPDIDEDMILLHMRTIANLEYYAAKNN